MIIFTDIDDTLMKTQRKVHNISHAHAGAYSESGEVLSYIEQSHYNFIYEFIDKHLVIPVTARSFSSLKRVTIPFHNEKIINFGAHILNDKNEINIQWHKNIIDTQKKLCIIEHANFIKNNFLYPSYMKLIERYEFDTFVFLNFRNSHINLDENRLFAKLINDFLINNSMNSFYLYITDQDVTIIPAYIKKQFAVSFLLQKYSHMTSIGIGDHKNDFPFMQLCNFSIFPNDSSLSKLLKDL